MTRPASSPKAKGVGTGSSVGHRIVPASVVFRLTLLIALVAGCKKEETRLRAAEIHAITRELGAAAANVAPPASEIRSEGRASDERPEEADHLYVTLPADSSEAVRRTDVSRLLQSFRRVATRHALTQDEPMRSGGLLRLAYRHAGVTTHVIHMLAPIPARSAKASDASSERARLAIILDDLGSDRAAADAIFALPYPLTISILPDHPHSTEIAEEAHRRGYEVMLHLPMQSVTKEKPEPAELRPGLPPSEVAELVGRMLASVPHVAGVNNHQGSQATADLGLMNELMPVLRDHHLFYIDSRTTAATVAYETAQRDGIPSAYRNVPFLDDIAELPAVRKQLELAVRGASEKGEAIAIGHPHPATLQALTEVLPTLESQGVRLVFASDIVR